MKRIVKIFSFVFVFGLLGSMLVGMAATDVAMAGGAPVRPTPQPTTPPPALTNDNGNAGGWIMLQASTTAVTSGMWTRIEWQDPNTGLWQEVGGWQGEFDGDKRVTWYVDPANFGQGPFRWVVYSDQTQAEVVTTSDNFTLPETRWQTVGVVVAFE